MDPQDPKDIARLRAILRRGQASPQELKNLLRLLVQLSRVVKPND